MKVPQLQLVRGPRQKLDRGRIVPLTAKAKTAVTNLRRAPAEWFDLATNLDPELQGALTTIMQKLTGRTVVPKATGKV